MLTRASDEQMIERALELAEMGRYTASPNPLVGAVIARRGRIVGEGFHRRAGEAHAEIEAIRGAGDRACGATLYVTLEPCCHVGRTGPCAEAIIQAGIARVVACRKDPNPAVSGGGFRKLRRARIVVETGLRAREAALQNERFDVWVLRKRPFVLAKVAATLDGRIADFRGRSRWITGPEARRRAMEWREELDAVLVGAATVAADDPRLTRRLGLNRSTPHRRIVLDGRFRVPETARIFRRPEGVEVWTGTEASVAKEKRLAERGIRIRRWPARDGGGIDLRAGLRALGREEVSGLLVEGGRQTLTSFALAGLIDRWAIFLAPRILGGERALALLAGPDRPLENALELLDPEWSRCGRDMLVTGRPRS